MPQKKILRITFIDGSTDEQELKLMPQHFRLPANDVTYIQTCLQVFGIGFVDLCSNDKYMKWVPPSQIKFIEIIFQETEPLKITKS